MCDSNYHAQTKRSRADVYASRMSQAERKERERERKRKEKKKKGGWTLNLENLGTVLL